MDRIRAQVFVVFSASLLTIRGALYSATWNTDVDNSLWNVDANWTAPSTFPNAVDAVANFLTVGTAFRSVDLGQNITVGTLHFDNSNAYDIYDSSATPTFSLTFDVSVGNPQLNLNTTNGDATHEIDNTVVLNKTLILNQDTSQFFFAGEITGSGGITKQGPGRTILQTSGFNNTFTGTTTIEAGNISLNALNFSFPITLPGLVIIDGGTLELDNGGAIGSLDYRTGTLDQGGGIQTLELLSTGNALTMRNQTIDGPISFPNPGGATITFDTTNGGTATLNNADIHLNDGNYTFNIPHGNSAVDMEIDDGIDQFLGGTGNIIKTGTGTLRFSPPLGNSYSGLTTVSGGILAVNSGSNFAIPGSVHINGGTLRLDASEKITPSATLTQDSGGFDMQTFDQHFDSYTFNGGVLTQTGTLTLTNTSTALTMRDTTIPGPVKLDGDIVFDATNGGVATISGNLDIKSTAGSAARTFTIGGTGAQGMTVSGIISNTGTAGVVKAGTGTLTFSGGAANTYSSGALTTVSVGTLALSKTVGPAVPSTQVTIASGATISIGAAANQFVTNGILTVDGTLTLNNNDQIVGSSPGSSTATINLGSAQLTTGGAGQFTFDGTITGTGGSILIPGAADSATYIFTGTNSYTGGITINQGNLQGHSGSLKGNISNTGPDTLTFAQTFDGTCAGKITSVGPFVKTGGGTLSLTGSASSLSTATVSGGRLAVNTPLISPLTVSGALTVNSGTSLGGAGALAAGSVLIQNGATLSPGNSIGTLTIFGPVTQATGSTLEIEISPSGSTVAHDEVVINGSYTIQPGATLLIEPTPGIYPASFDFPIVDALPGQLSGTFSNVLITLPTFQVTVQYLTIPGDIDLSGAGVVQLPFSSFFTSGNEGAVAACLDTLSPAPGSDLELVIGELRFIPTLDLLGEALNEMQPSQFTALALAQEYATLYTNETLFSRLLQISETCEDAHCLNKKRAYWISGYGAFSTQRDQSDNPGFRTADGGITTGIDYQICPTGVLGAAVGYSAISLSWKHHRGHADMQNGYGALYGNFEGKKGYLMGSLIGSYNSYHESRHIVIGNSLIIPIDRKAKSHHHGYQVSGQMRGGFLYPFHGVEFSPFGELDYLYVHENGFREHGAKSLNLKVRSKDSDLLKGEVGLAVNRCFSLTKNQVAPFLSLSVLHEWRFMGKKYKASFEDSSCVMHVKGINPDRTLFSGSLGLTFLLPDEKQTLSLEYKGRFGDRYQDNQFLAQYLFHF
jgi:autotransporter-associated beta strand protein